MEPSKDVLWSADPRVLLKAPMEFVFNHTYSEIRNVNAMARMIIYWSLLSLIVVRKPFVLVMGLLALLFLASQRPRVSPKYFHDSDEATALSYCQKPSKDNPMANALVSDYGNGMKLPACVSSAVKDDIREQFKGHEITGPVYELAGMDANSRASERQFHSMPVTTVANERAAFAHALYGTQLRRERA